MSENDETVYLNSCDLLVESLNLRSAGTYYLVWKKGKKHTQSNKYQLADQQIFFPRELLSLSLKIYTQGTATLPRHTHLILYNAANEEIDRAKIMIHEWTSDYKETTISLGGGSVKLKVKRKSLMKLQKFHRLRSQVQETSQDERTRFLKKTSREMNNEQEQVIKLRKEVEDVNFLVDKLKEERNLGLVKIERLETELRGVNERMRKDLTKLREYFKLKIEMRESIYKEEIQQLVSSFNRNYELNFSTMETLIKDKIQLEREIVELNEANQEYIAEQEKSFAAMMDEMENQKQLIDAELKDSNTKLREREETIARLNGELDSLNLQHKRLQQQKKAFQLEKEEQNRNFTRVVAEKDDLLTDYSTIIETDKQLIKRIEADLTNKVEEITNLSRLFDENLAQKQELTKINMELNQKSENLFSENQVLKFQTDKQRTYMNDLDNEMKKLRDEYEAQMQNMISDMNQQDQLSKQEVEAERVIVRELTLKYEEVFNENEMNKSALEEFGLHAQQKEEELVHLHTELENQRTLANNLQNEMNENLMAFKHSQQEMSDRLTEGISRNSQLQSFNVQLKNDYRELSVKSQEEIDKMRDQYERMLQSNRRLYDDEIDLVKKERENETMEYDTMKNDYQKELNQMIEHQKNQLEEIERTFKEELEQKTKENFELLQKFNKLNDEFQEFKVKVHLEELKKGSAKEKGSKKNKGKLSKKHRLWNTDQIEELSDEDEDEDGQEAMETVEIESDEEDEPVMPKRKKKKTSKKKLMPLRAESDQEEQEAYGREDQQEEDIEIIIDSQGDAQQQQGSIVDMIKHKRQITRPKSKLKVKKYNLLKYHAVQPDEEEEAGQIPVKGSKLKMKRASQLKREEEGDEQEAVQEDQQQKHAEQIHESAEQDEEQERSVQPRRINKKIKTETSLNYSQQSVGKKRLHMTEGGMDMQEFQRVRGEMEGRIQALEDEIVVLKRGETKMKKEEKKYLNQIAQLEIQIADLKADGEEVAAKLAEQTKKLKEYSKSKGKGGDEAIEEIIKVQVEPKSPRTPRTPGTARLKTPPVSERRLKVEDRAKSQRSLNSEKKQSSKQKSQFNEKRYKDKLSELQITLEEKARKIARLEKTIGELEKELGHGRSADRAGMDESKILYKTGNDQRLMSFVDPELKMSIANLQVRVSSEKERYHELKLRYEQLTREHSSLQEDYKRAKRSLDDYEQKEKKRVVPRSIQEMQNELDDANRKILELSRVINQTRLEKDSLEDEVRMVRKKLGEVGKVSAEMQSKASALQRENEDVRRKEQKLKREIQEWQQQVKRLKDHARNTLQELAQTRKSQSEFVLQRKKVLDEVVRLEGVIANKETEMIRSTKENQKLRGRLNEGESTKKERDRSLHVELEKLEIERSQLQRKNRESEEAVKMLKQKLEVTEKESKRTLEERKQAYSEKLKQYIAQVMSVKKVVEEFQQENTRLKLQNSEFFQQNEIIKMSIEKLHIKNEDLMDQQAFLSEELAKWQKRTNELEQTIKKKGAEEEKTQTVLGVLRKQLDSERVASRKKTQKLQSFQQINQRYLYEIKNFKIRLNEHEANADQNTKLNEQVYMSQRTIDSLQEQLHKISEEYSEHSSKYVYTKEDVDCALKQLKEHEDRVKQEEFINIIEEFDRNSASQRQKVENELILLYTENEKLRSSLQKSAEEALQLQLQFSQIQGLRQKCKRSEKERSVVERKNVQLLDEVKSLREQIRRIEIRYNEAIRSQQGKSTETVVLMQKYDEMSKRYQQVNESYNELKIEDRRIIQKYKAVNEEKEREIEALSAELQNLSNKLMGSEFEVSRLKDMASYSNQDYLKKIRILEGQVEETVENGKQREAERELLHRAQLKEVKGKMAKYETEIEDKLNRIEELNEGVLMLQREVEEITDELTKARTQLGEEGEYYTIEINKLRNQMRQMQVSYDETIKNLEEELSAMSKELTSVKFARETNNSRLKVSRLSEGGDDKSSKKYEERLKFKERRIEELKQTVMALEEKLGELMRKQGKSSELEGLRIKYVQLQRVHKQGIDKKSQQLSKMGEECKRVKADLAKCKNEIEQLTLRLQQKEMEIASQRSEIETMGKLYADLQREIDKRKEGLNLQIKQESSLKLDLQTKGKQITFLSRQIEQLHSELASSETVLKKKTLENRNLSQINEQLQKDKHKLMDLDRHKLQGENFAKLKIKEMQAEIQTLRTENRRLKNQLGFAMKENDRMKSQLAIKNTNILELAKQIEINDKKIADSQNLLIKFIGLNEQCIKKMGISLEELIGWSMRTRQSLEAKQQQLGKLNDELEELRFLQERKMLDFEELKKENYELVLKTEERQINYQQLQQMSEQLVEFSRERQQLLFREGAIKVQLNNICSNLNSDKSFERHELRRRIENVINGAYV